MPRLNFLNHGVTITNGFNSPDGFIVHFEPRRVDLIIPSLTFSIVSALSSGRAIECALIQIHRRNALTIWVLIYY